MRIASLFPPLAGALLAGACASPPPPRPAPEPIRAAPPPPRDPDAGPQPMPVDEFKQLVRALDREPGGDEAKLTMIRTAAAGNWFLAGEVALLIDHLTYRPNKLAALPILAGRITDRDEAWKIVEKFTYREDKAQAEAELQAR